MPARLNPQHDARTRSKIQTSQLVNRLNSFALDTTDSIRMTSDQVRAALGLLRKTIPDLAVTAHAGEDVANIFLLHLEAARATSQQLIEGKVEPAPERETTLLDQSLPTE
jgi:hypothetical protein